MNYHQIQQLKRDLDAGLYTAPQPFPVVDLNTLREENKNKKRRIVFKDPESSTTDDWYDEGFIDHFYDNTDANEEDVTPDYFSACGQLLTDYFCDDNIDHMVTSKPLFRGSKYCGKDLARFLLSFKARYLKVGDGILANIVAIMATFLPEENTLRECLPQKPSTYYLLKALDNLAYFKTSLRCLKIDCCVGKCMGFYAGNSHLNLIAMNVDGNSVHTGASMTTMRNYVIII